MFLAGIIIPAGILHYPQTPDNIYFLREKKKRRLSANVILTSWWQQGKADFLRGGFFFLFLFFGGSWKMVWKTTYLLREKRREYTTKKHRVDKFDTAFDRRLKSEKTKWKIHNAHEDLGESNSASSLSISLSLSQCFLSLFSPIYCKRGKKDSKKYRKREKSL